MAESLIFGHTIDIYADIFRINGVPYSPGSSVESYTLSLTNNPGSARTEVGTAATIRINKVNNMVYLTFWPGTLGTLSNADAGGNFSFNEVLPLEYRFDNTPSVSYLAQPCLAVNDSVTNPSVLVLDASGHFIVYANYDQADFTSGTLVGVPFQSITMSYPTVL